MNDEFLQAVGDSDSVYVTVQVNCDNEATVRITKAEARRLAGMHSAIKFIRYEDGTLLIDKYGECS